MRARRQGRVGRLVDDVTEVVEASGRGRLAGLQPRFTGLAALPGARRKSEDLDLHAAALQRARENVGARRGHGDRASAHRSRIVEQQRHDRIAEIGILFPFEGEWLLRIDDDPRQARRIQHALFEVELPRPVLLRHQAALQPIGEPRDDGGEVLQLLVQKRPQPLELLWVAEVFGSDRFVIGPAEALVVRAAILVGSSGRRTTRVGGLLRVGIFGFFIAFAAWRLGGVHGRVVHLLRRRFRLFALATLVGALGVALTLLVLFRVGFSLVGRLVVLALVIGRGFLSHFERREQLVDRLREELLVLEG